MIRRSGYFLASCGLELFLENHICKPRWEDPVFWIKCGANYMPQLSRCLKIRSLSLPLLILQLEPVAMWSHVQLGIVLQICYLPLDFFIYLSVSCCQQTLPWTVCCIFSIRIVTNDKNTWDLLPTILLVTTIFPSIKELNILVQIMRE